MRTTLSIEEDVLLAAKALAKAQKRTVGDVMSDLARQSLIRPPATLQTRNGIPLLPIRDRNVVVTTELVDQLRDELE